MEPATQISPRSYEVLEEILHKHLRDGEVLIDVGSNKGIIAYMIDRIKTGCHVFCLDADYEALQHIPETLENGTKTIRLNQSFWDYLRQPREGAHIFNRSLHHVVDPRNQEGDMERIFLALRGLIVIGDTYISPEVSDEDWERRMRLLEESTNHRHKKGDYVHPHLILNAANKNGFELLEYQRCEDGVGEFYYAMVLRK